MSNFLTKIINAETGEEIEREMTVDEKAVRDAQLETYFAEKAKKEAETAAKAAEKAALLAKLGITEDEAKLLLA
jgi:hypothetical protein